MCDDQLVGVGAHDCQDDLDLVIKDGHTILQINYRRLQEIPPQLLSDPTFNSLQKLHMKRNLLKTLPTDLKNLSGLVELYLHSNDIQCLPEGISDLINLKYLDVSSNQLEYLPNSLGKLSQLQRLQLSSNKLRRLPASIGNLHMLESLECMNNELTSLPLELCNCSSLITLNLDNNRLQLLPRQVYKLNNLTELSVVGNNLLVLPNDLGKMSSLKYIYLDNNQYLGSVPAGALDKNIGYHSCGMNGPTDEMKTSFCHIAIRHSETEDRSILLPPEIKMVGTGDAMVPPLLEMCLRTFSKFLQNSNSADLDDIKEHVPSSLQSLINVPTSRCQVCCQEIFVAGFPMIFQASKKLPSSESPYLLALCCSKPCLKPCFFSFNYPLVYPTLDVLNLAVARA